MSRIVKQQILELEQPDEQILRLVAGECRTSRAQVLRWALRWYLIGGPWPPNPELRRAAVGECHVGPVGPHPSTLGGAR